MPTGYENNLTAKGFANPSPAWAIIHGPTDLWTRHQAGDTVRVLLGHLTANFHTYGRLHGWTWRDTVNGNADGVGVLDGTITATNCGGFNRSLLYLGNEILQVDGANSQYWPGANPTQGPLGETSRFTTASHNGSFMTHPRFGNLNGLIDTAWHGNVCTPARHRDQVRALYFGSHAWATWTATGDLYDPTSNTHTVNRGDILWETFAAYNATPGFLEVTGGAWAHATVQLNGLSIMGRLGAVRQKLAAKGVFARIALQHRLGLTVRHAGLASQDPLRGFQNYILMDQALADDVLA